LTPILSAQNLTKSFRNFKAVEDVSFSVAKGTVYGFLGENGAGKSTTMRMLLGLIKPDRGEVRVNGVAFNNQRRYLLKHVGAIIERPDMYGYLSGWDNLRMMAQLSGAQIGEKRMHDVLDLVGLKGREKDKVKAYSQGMKQRLGIAIALVHEPELLILDEPTNGLDPQGIAEIRNLILHLSKDMGKTILISSHLLNEVEQVANEMLILHKGKKVIEGNVKELLDPKETLFEVKLATDTLLSKALNESQWSPFLVSETDDTLTFKLHPGQVPDLNRWLVAHGAAVMEIKSKHSLEAYFLSLTNDATDKTGTI
jgi:ABC-type multidrug transport system ATPase subunit